MSREESIKKTYESVPVKTLVEFYVDDVKPFFHRVFDFANIITRVYGFLILNRGVQYTTHQIAEAVDAPYINTFNSLQNLKSRGIVKHLSRYTWIAEAE